MTSQEDRKKYDVFISYSRYDMEFVRSLVSDLKQRDVKVWFDQFEIQPGDPIFRKSQEGLRNSRYVLILFSPSSVSSSWFRREILEIQSAVSADPSSSRDRLIPVILGQVKLPSEIDLLRKFDVSDPSNRKTIIDEIAAAISKELPSDIKEVDALIDIPKFATYISFESSQINVPQALVQSGPAEVIASGTVIAFQGNPISIQFGFPMPLTVEFEFETDTENPGKPRFHTSAWGEHVLQLRLTNFDNSLGSGTVKPIPFGQRHERQLWIHFRVYKLGSSEDRTLHYTIFQETGVKVDD